MRRYDKITPEGTMDYLFKECKIRRNAENRVRNLFENYGYDEVMTTSLEFYDVFSEGVGRVSQNELYTLTDGSGRLITMRPDSTKPIARLFASRLKDFVLPIKLYYSQPVFKRNLSFNRKSDEIIQMGIELIGGTGYKSDLEILILGIKSMKELFGDDFFIEIGHMGIIGSVLDSFGQFKEAAKSAISKKNFPEVDLIASKLGEKGKILKEIARLFGGKEILSQAKNILKDNQAFSAVLELEKLYQGLMNEGLQDNILFDLSILNDYQYYTGMVFRCFVDGVGTEVMSGGRYDSLYGDYGLNIPAIGFAINFNEALEILSKMEIDDLDRKKAVVFSSSSAQVNYEDPIFVELKERGYRCVVSLCDSEEDTIKWANAIKAKIVITIDKDGKIKENDI
jgi:ATP phosphoribosyltransferase regulatory subunit